MMTRAPHFRNPARRGFTLIEVMVVVAIIVILSAIGIAVGVAVKRGAVESQTKVTLDALDSAMAAFLKDNPEPTDATWNAALRSYPESARVLKSIDSSSATIQDAYGNPIHYIPANSTPTGLAPWTPKPVGFFWSYGADSVPGGDDLFSKGVGAQQ